MIFSILIIISFIVIILFSVQKKQKSFTSELLTVKSNYERELFTAQMEIQEQTLKKISREIHDNVSQLLSLGKLGLGTLNLGDIEETSDSIAEISDILEKAQDELRQLSRSMNSEIVSKGGLLKSVETQLGFIQRGGKYEAHMEVVGEPVSLNNEKEIILFRIVQEAINNIIRHAASTEICISLDFGLEFLKLQINDNGKGFNLNEQCSGSKTYNGIYNMQQRAKQIDGNFAIESQPNKGTQITIITPLN